MTTKFYQEDLVHSIDDPSLYGVVLRCWHDPEDIPPPASLEDPLLRALQPGEVGVSFFPRREILPESQFKLVDRSFQIGDSCKRTINDARSGVVLRTEVKSRLKHAITGEPLLDWMNSNDIQPAIDVEMGDYVVCDDWVGQVIELFDEALIEVANGKLVKLPELSARLSVGENGSDIVPHPASGMHSLLSLFNASSNSVDTVVSIKHTVLAVSWLAINQSLDPEIAQSRERPPRMWHGSDINKLALVRGRSSTIRVGERVLLKDESKAKSTKHGRSADEHGVVEVRHHVVRETNTTVTVLWQDNVQETLPSVDLIPHLNPDEHDCWPGDHVIWKSDGTARPAVVQSVNSSDRTAYIRFTDQEGPPELASVLELDPHGTYDVSAAPTDDLGIRRGDFVFIHRAGSTNGAPKSRVPRIGELENWVREIPTFGFDGQIGGWRKEISDLGASIASTHSKGQVHSGTVQKVQVGDTRFNWFGEVTGLHLDGSVEVTLPDTSTVNLPLERLTRLYDGLEQLEDIWGDEMSEDQGPIEDMDVWNMEDGGQWRHNDPTDADDWEDDDSGSSSMDVDADVWDGTDSLIEAIPVEDFLLDSTTSTPHEFHPPDEPAVEPVMSTEAQTDTGHQNWKRFDILASAPADHAFFATAPSQPSRAFLGRLTKEYRALSNSLPDSIIVRAYEDRTDLLRSLIIGSENTPYEDAPFVIDWMLDSNFPVTPPIAHFISWTNGNGRVNPNLYEEGKVCLSILGTWAGDADETWSAARSSILQALVSIQGLVLVKEPYFCEPAYDKFRGTEEGIVNSRLYNEKAYVLSRGFISRALELRLPDLESEIDWMYFANGKLDKVLQHSEALIERSKAPGAEADDGEYDLAIPRLTAGGIIALQRVLGRLKSLRSSRDG